MRRTEVPSVASHEYVLEKKYRNEEEQSYKPRRRPFSKYIVDFNEGTFLTRTTLSWLKILLYFTIFYCAICGFWVANFIVFQRSLDLEKPRVLREQPGLSFSPQSEGSETFPKIEYTHGHALQYRKYVNSINKFLGKFGKEGRKHFEKCNADGSWGYKSREPCVFLKMNRILGWHAQPYTTVASLPKEVPIELKNMVNGFSKEEMQDRVWISCAYPRDQVEEVLYFPGPYIGTKYLEYDGKKYYKKTELLEGEEYTKDRQFFSKRDYERIVAVLIKNPNRGESVKFQCNAWAKNIDRGANRQSDMVTFSIQID